MTITSARVTCEDCGESNEQGIFHGGVVTRDQPLELLNICSACLFEKVLEVQGTDTVVYILSATRVEA